MQQESVPASSKDESAIPVLIVAYRNAADVKACLEAIGRMDQSPPMDVFICENGGRDAFDRLVASLTGPGGPCEADLAPPMVASPRFVQVTQLCLRAVASARPIRVHIGEAIDNLGYAGGVNAFLEPLLRTSGWPGVWVLNPDTEPAPAALGELVRYAAAHERGMVGSRLRPRESADIVITRGLAWSKWRAGTRLVDRLASASVEPDPEQVDLRLDAPSGASMYVTRDCIARIGVMDERYFLYFEDLDWGLRAKRNGPVGYAHRSIVVHDGGTTIGSASSWRQRSQLSVYLDFRNRLAFVRRYYPNWLAWTILIEVLEIANLARLFAFGNVGAAARGLSAGLRGASGRPNEIVRAHLMSTRERTP
ncbi:glycosyltransferase family 2 protein [Methylocapsa palsarum]|uniref:Glycosyltransferase, GT2 family n=1 Tax=Methylocapsa palsarum TaxID=1612308 RepID=A0A1I4C6X5_9HYPH|nr:glycosyltransferase family 2 protein [Methylocapsa palsarum]SFK76888.1 Glycosyltransferase, GT2 family [Methylocapsa palsarum]